MSFLEGYGEFGIQLLTARPLCTETSDPKLSLSRAWLGEDSDAGSPGDTPDIDNVISDISGRLSPELITKLKGYLKSTYRHGASPLNRVLGLMASLGLSLRKDPEQTVYELVGALATQGIVSPPPDSDEHGRVELGGLILSCLGWFTRLYRLPDEPSEDKSSSHGASDVDISTYIDRPFFEFITNAGSLTTSRKAPYYSTSNDDSGEPVQVVCLDADTLTTVGHITIEWTDSLGKHLEFDERGRVLFLFRLPSFCRLHQSPNSILNIFTRHMFDENFHDESWMNEFVADFMTEVLASYSLIFHTTRSHKLYKHRYRDTRKECFVDPQLDELCGFQRSRFLIFKSTIISFIAPPTDAYVSPCSLPILYPRFQKLFRYVQRRQAHGLKSLYFDRRDAYKWWTFWAVIWVGGTSVLLSLIQMVIAGVSLHYAKVSLYYTKLSVPNLNVTDS